MESQDNSLPKSVNEIARKAILAIKSHPKHHLDWKIRRELYQSFGEYSDRKVQLARGWLAVLTAQKVLPIFTNEFPQYSLPLKLIATAMDELAPKYDLNYEHQEEILRTERHKERVDILIDTAYVLLGRPDLYEYYSYRSSMVTTAANKALMEATGWGEPFKGLDGHYKRNNGNEGVMLFTGDQKELNESEWEPLANSNEENWIHRAAVGDTAGVAAIAFSKSSVESTIDSEKLKEFWLWWLKDALVESWRLAELILDKD